MEENEISHDQRLQRLLGRQDLEDVDVRVEEGALMQPGLHPLRKSAFPDLRLAVRGVGGADTVDCRRQNFGARKVVR